MPMRLAKVTELNLLIAIQHGVWGARKDTFRSWREGDELAFVVGKSLAALAEVAGSARQSSERIWPDDLYPFRIPVIFKQFVMAGERPPLLGDVREALMAEYGAKWGFAMINQSPVPEQAERAIVAILNSTPNHMPQALRELATLIDQAGIAREVEQTRPRAVEPPADSGVEPTGDRTSPQEESLHTRAQGALIELGRAVRCSTWVASSDRSKLWKGTPLGDRCVKVLPAMGLSGEAMSRISLIDLLWLQHNAPAFAFEIEVTTSVYSGLLRMSDLLALVPALKMNLFVVAPAGRRGKVMAELARPTFKRIGLSDYCRFVGLESLEALIEKIDIFRGYVHPGVIETIAEELQDDLSEETA